MRVIRTVGEMEEHRERVSGSVGLVPTMGYLHEGHVSIVRRARTDDDHVVVSIFVNPTQFGPNEDFERYPRDETRDLGMLESEGVDIVFSPSVEEMYPPDFDDWIEVSGPVTERLEGRQKDAQQLRVIRRMVADLGLPVDVIGLPTVRESDGLAMSSRNVYLSPEERQAALVLSRSLQRAQVMAAEGEWDAARIRSEVEGMIQQEPLVALDYVSVADDETLEELAVVDRPALLLLAARAGKTRLIDNVALLPIDGLPAGRG